MSGNLIHEFEHAGDGKKFTIDEIRDFKPVGRSLPDVYDTESEMYICKSKVVKAADPVATHKEHGKLSSFLGNLSRANRAATDVGAQYIDGKYYCQSPKGLIIEMTLVRRLKGCVGGAMPGGGAIGGGVITG